MKQTIEITLGEIKAPQIELIATSPRGPVGPQGVPSEITPTTLHSGSAHISVASSDEIYGGTTYGLSDPMVNYTIQGESITYSKQNSFIHCPLDTNKFNLYASYTGASNDNQNFRALLYLVLENGTGSSSAAQIQELLEALETAQAVLEWAQNQDYASEIAAVETKQAVVVALTAALVQGLEDISNAQQSIAHTELLSLQQAIEDLFNGTGITVDIDALSDLFVTVQALIDVNDPDIIASQAQIDTYDSQIAALVLSIAALQVQIDDTELDIDGATVAIIIYQNAYDNFASNHSWYDALVEGLNSSTGVADLHNYGPGGDNLPEEFQTADNALIIAQAAYDASPGAGTSAALAAAQAVYDSVYSDCEAAMDTLFTFTTNAPQNTILTGLLTAELFTTGQGTQITIDEFMAGINNVSEISTYPSNPTDSLSWTAYLSSYNSMYTDYQAIGALSSTISTLTIDLAAYNTSQDTDELAKAALVLLNAAEQVVYDALVAESLVFSTIMDTLPGLKASLESLAAIYYNTYSIIIVSDPLLSAIITMVLPDYPSLTQSELDTYLASYASNTTDLALELVWEGNTYISATQLLEAIDTALVTLQAQLDTVDEAIVYAVGIVADAQLAYDTAVSGLNDYGLQPLGYFPFSKNIPKSAPGFINQEITVDLVALGLPDFSFKGARLLLAWAAETPQQYNVSYTLTAN